jgi:hypothetical protein
MIGLCAAKVFSGAMIALMENLTDFIPDNEQRKIFGEKLMEEYHTGKCHASVRTYGTTAF